MTSAGASARPVLVGADGSASSMSAVAWAAAEALRRDRPLTVVCVTGTRPLGPPLLADSIVADARDFARRVAPGVVVRTAVHVGDPVAVLGRIARDCALLVVGRHGRPRGDGHPPGGTAAALARSVPVPVVIIGFDEAAFPREGCTGPALPRPTVARSQPRQPTGAGS